MRRSFLCIFTALTVFFLTLMIIAPQASEAASCKFKYKNVTTGEIIKYNGKIPTFSIDGEEIDTSEYPAVIIDGISMVSVRLFTEGCGAEYFYNKETKQLTFTYDEQTLVMTLGQKSAYLDGRSKMNSNFATPFRVKYYATGEYTNFVPARFVAELFGMSYEWHQDTTSIDITTPIPLLIKGEYEYYNGTLGKLKYEGEIVKNSKTPSYIFQDNALICLKTISNAIDGMRYSYDSDEGTLSISYGEVTLDMQLDTTLVAVNGIYETCPIAPTEILNTYTGINRIYVPGRYVFERLGFSYEWKTDTSVITKADTAGTVSFKHDFALLVNAENNISKKAAESTEAVYGTETVFHQIFDFPILEGVRPELLNIKDYIYDYLISFDLPGNYMSYYSEHLPVNTGEAIQQVQILYFEEPDITRVNIYTRTNKDNIILAYKLNTFEDRLEFTFDRAGCLFDKIIVLDAGHGGTDPGAIGGGKYKEKDLNFSIVNNYCKSYFEDSDIKVFYTRADDYLTPLHTRPTIPARVDADLFISVHHNSNNNKAANGTSVYYSHEDTGDFNGLNSKAMAQTFLSALLDKLDTKNMGAIDYPYVVISEENTVPAVLLEIGFLSNPDELSRMVKKAFQKKVAKCIFDTVNDIYATYTR